MFCWLRWLDGCYLILCWPCVVELLSDWCDCTSCGLLIVLGSSFSYFDFIVYLLW